MPKILPVVKVGGCGFSGNRKDYFSQFKVIELQHTFYKIPKLETALGLRCTVFGSICCTGSKPLLTGNLYQIVSSIKAAYQVHT
jgi:hypothetical protein